MDISRENQPQIGELKSNRVLKLGFQLELQKKNWVSFQFLTEFKF
jgi:hypothetical protein